MSSILAGSAQSIFSIMKRALCCLLFLQFCFSTPALAIYDPLSVPNNKYGIHIADSNDIPDVSTLVNSNGGSWGYVTLVIQETDRNVDKWKKIFNQLRRNHLIPLVRLATHTEEAIWTKPQADSFNEWADFLSQLNWPTQNRYVILFNEPNHAKEWGGAVNPEEYAYLSQKLTTLLKEKSSDFFILPAGLDGSAPNGAETVDEATFLTRIQTSDPSFFDSLDGWTSHSYPNPGFSGSPYATGKGTIQHFVWEQDYLRSFGIAKDYPIFITETGWSHSQGKINNYSFLSTESVAQNFKTASIVVWSNPKIAAITPFVFSYLDYPFDHFSMKMLGTNDFYPQYYMYQSLPKIAGVPHQKNRLIPTAPLLPLTLIASSSYTFSGEVINEGQSIIDSADEFSLILEDESKAFTFTSDRIPTLEPGNKGVISFRLKTPQTAGSYRLTLALDHYGRKSVIESHTIRLSPPPSVTLQLQLAYRPKSTIRDITVLIYDDRTLLTKFTNREAKNGMVTVSGLTNIIPGKQYRVVALVPYYLPRQTIIKLQKENTHVDMPRFLPLDFNGDGTFTFKDFTSLLQIPPHRVFSLLFGL